ncbi:MAG TPA: hypothetical protein VFC64_05320 [Atopostipes sp.]|nr:hypothetical protein [Atopostipes sp.]
METLKELKNRQSKEINAFNIGAAFNNQQFEEMMSKFGLGVDDTSKILSLGAGMYILKAERTQFNDLLARHKKELSDFKKDRKRHIESIIYDFNNMEVDFTHGFINNIETIGLTKEALDADPKLNDVVIAAWSKYAKQQLK